MVTAATVARTLGGVGRGRAAGTEFALLGAVRDGLPLSALDRLIADDTIAEAEIKAHLIPRRALYSRRQKGTLSHELPDQATVETIKLSPPASDPIACWRYGDTWATGLRSAAFDTCGQQLT
jgi:hypothetical protein